MRRQPSFEDALSLALELEQHEPVVVEAPRLAPAPPFSYVLLNPGVRQAVADLRHVETVAAGAASQESATPKIPAGPARFTRTLTDREADALRDLVNLGATLHPDFTRAELRSAFRLLARHYHPDRHPGCTRFEHARLARVFAKVTAHYRCLLDATDR